MKCEEFEAIGLGLGREGAVLQNGVDATERAAAIEHANTCARCAALQESWQEARAELRALRVATQDAGTPLRVEMRVRQEFRTRHRTAKVRAAAVVAAWTLAAAAVVVGAVSLRNWQGAQHHATQGTSGLAKNTGPGNMAVETGKTMSVIDSKSTNENALIADNSAGEFTLLPGSLPQETGDAAIVRVRLQRGALGALGLPVNQERAGEWIQVDLLVGEDGQPQAVRLPQ
jgi:anti-sigma factor RsiW